MSGNTGEYCHLFQLSLSQQEILPCGLIPTTIGLDMGTDRGMILGKSEQTSLGITMIRNGTGGYPPYTQEPSRNNALFLGGFAFRRNNLKYHEQLQHPRWQKKRLEKLSSVNFCCELCHNTEHQLDVHHKRYKRGALVWEYDNSELLSLCKRCHAEVHSIDERVAKALAVASIGTKEIIIEMLDFIDASNHPKMIAFWQYAMCRYRFILLNYGEDQLDREQKLDLDFLTDRLGGIEYESPQY